MKGIQTKTCDEGEHVIMVRFYEIKNFIHHVPNVVILDKGHSDRQTYSVNFSRFRNLLSSIEFRNFYILVFTYAAYAMLTRQIDYLGR